MAKEQSKIRIKVKAFDHKMLDKAVRQIIETAERTGAMVAGPIPLPTKIDKITILKSTFKHKDAREQLEMRTHKRLMDITGFSSKTMDELQKLDVSAGVDIEIKMIAV